MHPDVRRAGIGAEDHYLHYGLHEGRAYKLTDQPGTRHEFLSGLAGYASILEIGPFDRPVAPEFTSPNTALEFADWQSTDELKARAQALPDRNPDQVPRISYVASSRLANVINRKFECVVSSHMIEHTPDLIGHIKDVRSLLQPGGAYLFLCPDKRHCFDHFLPESRLPEVVAAYLEQRTRPTLRSVIEHRAFTRQDFSMVDDPLLMPTESDWAAMLLAKQEFDSSMYVDVHCWQFTPDSLRQLIEAITSLGIVDRPSRLKIIQLGGEIGGLINW